ncbi:HET-domain-containing protein [Acephala macrosclerotiorum]|nr:HET-domain-containing protein [Acephala macrosclerotiorum]
MSQKGAIRDWLDDAFALRKARVGWCGFFVAIPLLVLSPIWFPGAAIYIFLTPDFETSLVQGYKRPVIGLKLCRRCKALKYRLWGKARHHANYQRLRSSAAKGCWLCHAVEQQWGIALQDHAQPPVLTDPSELRRKIPHLLLWFVDKTVTATGYLDDLKGLDYYQYFYGSQPRALQDDPSSDATFRLICGWLSLCIRDHHCYQGEHKFFPTRVIDVSGSIPRLRVSHGIDEPYMTLSHCWGSAQPLVTKAATLENRLREIPLQSLPEMFQDAVFITRRLKIKYLWIDSLCIIQDSEEDWAREASKMGDVYRYAYLTIVILDSTDCHQRILSPRKTSPAKDIVVEELKSPVLGDKQAVFKQSPLCHRAWALQERLLSPRVLFYSKGEIFWECLACTVREGSPRVKTYRPSEYSYTSYECPDVKNCLILPRGESPSMPLSPPSYWHIIVVEYTRCYLTKPTDKLPALSGLASIFQANTGYSYIAGLWQEDLRDGLLWYVDQNQRQFRHKKSVYPGPSWSWVSTCFPVLYVTVIGSRSSPSLVRHQDIKFVGCDITPKDANNPMGEVVHASLTVEADFETFNLRNEESGVAFFDKSGAKVTVFLDKLDEKYPSGITCRGLFVVARDVQPQYYERDDDFGREIALTYPSWKYFLVVVPDVECGGCWRRIGLGRCSGSQSLFTQHSKRVPFELV